MKLRDHPLVRLSWPPMWCWRAGGKKKNVTGEVGILKQVQPYSIQPPDRFYLIMEYGGAEYLGVLLVEDYALCQQLFNMLAQHWGKTIREIGDIDLSAIL